MSKKVILLTVLMACLTLAANAQFHFGLLAGAGVANTRYKLNDETGTSNSVFSYHLGAALNYNMEISGGGLEFVSGLQFARHGGAKTVSGIEFTDSRYYLEVPLRVQYRLDLPIVSIYVGFGPEFNFGILGSLEVKPPQLEKKKYDVKWESEKQDGVATGQQVGNMNKVKRFDMALSMHAGIVLMDHLRVGGFYDYGLLNHSNFGSDAYVKDTTFGASITYFF